MADQSNPIDVPSSSSAATTAGNSGSSASANEQAHPTNSASPLQLPRGGLYAPKVDGTTLPDDSVTGIVARLMSPPQYFHNNGRETITITINWAVGVAGPERFERRGTESRYFLCRGDKLEEQGGAAGLSSEIMEWLKDGEETLTLPIGHFQ